MDPTVFVPILLFLIQKGWTVMTPNGIAIRTVEELEAQSAAIEALLKEAGGSFAGIAVPGEPVSGLAEGVFAEGKKVFDKLFGAKK